jgi:uncharacterized membrane protein
MDGQNNQQNNQSSGGQNNTPNMNNNLVLSVFAYLGPLAIVSYIAGKDDFTKFHARQGIILFGLEVLVWLLSTMSYSFWMILNLVNLATLILSIIGLVNVMQGHKKELPIVGGWGASFGLK